MDRNNIDRSNIEEIVKLLAKEIDSVAFENDEIAIDDLSDLVEEYLEDQGM